MALPKAEAGLFTPGKWPGAINQAFSLGGQLVVTHLAHTTGYSCEDTGYTAPCLARGCNALGLVNVCAFLLCCQPLKFNIEFFEGLHSCALKRVISVHGPTMETLGLCLPQICRSCSAGLSEG